MSEGFSSIPSTMDMSNVKEQTFEAFEAGTYNAEIVDVRPTAVKNETGKLPKGTPGINVQFVLTGSQSAMSAENPEKELDLKNRRVFKPFYIAPDGHGSKETQDSILYGFLKTVLGEDAVKNKKFNLRQVVEDGELDGAKVRVKVDVREYQGRLTNQVKYVLPPSGDEDDDAFDDDDL